ncbi:hypothetical protein HBH64_074280 [Parastagonospora nodorum]|nr:hypothetical protein HBH43_025490 [Parastagonospora nodorum]KAH4303133.1 hypothetical protein HBI01_083450 [Parastagonospora nodorum]KAH4318812.1 hypothetical protein HBI02_006160 [Parastagonospora nodorum]KAH4331763.1 hypothetical protein HBI00_065790 [Parastagonospora nodorum]KAH4372754.1 hypothetical protein HBH94_109220 [Parastagonospora nodorum]
MPATARMISTEVRRRLSLCCISKRKQWCENMEILHPLHEAIQHSRYSIQSQALFRLETKLYNATSGHSPAA